MIGPGLPDTAEPATAVFQCVPKAGSKKITVIKLGDREVAWISPTMPVANHYEPYKCPCSASETTPSRPTIK